MLRATKPSFVLPLLFVLTMIALGLLGALSSGPP